MKCSGLCNEADSTIDPTGGWFMYHPSNSEMEPIFFHASCLMDVLQLDNESQEELNKMIGEKTPPRPPLRAV